jgi:hypothetical protein
MRLALIFLVALSVGGDRRARGEDAYDALRFFPPDLVGYVRAPLPEESRLRSRFGPEVRARLAAAELARSLEVLAVWELGLTPAQIEDWKARFRCHVAFLPANREGANPRDRAGLEWMVVVEGLPEADLASHPAARAPVSFLGVAAYALRGGRVLAASRLSLVEAMLRRADGAGDGASFAGREDVRRMLGRVSRDEEVSFWDPAVMQGIESAGGGAATILLRGLIEDLGPLLLVARRASSEPEEVRTEALLDFQSRPETSRLYRKFRQAARQLTLGAYVPAEAVLTLLASLDARGLLETLRSQVPGGVEAFPTLLDWLGLQPLFDPEGPFLGWAAEADVREAAFFANFGIELFTPLPIPRAPPDWGMALRAGGRVSLEALAPRLHASGWDVARSADGILEAVVPDGRILAFAEEGDVVLVSNDSEIVTSMRQARATGRSLAERAEFLDLFPQEQRRSKALFFDATLFKTQLERLLRFVSVSFPPGEFLLGAEMVEEADALRVWLGSVPDLAEVIPASGPSDSVVLGAIFGRTPMRRTEEQALGLLLALREGERRFRAEERRDTDGDGIGEFGDLTELGRAGTRFLPESLRVEPGSLEGEAFGYLFRVDVPADSRRAAATFVAYAWPKEYGVTGVSSFLVREEGSPYRGVSEAFSGTGRGPRPRGAFSLPSTWPESTEMLTWSPLLP